MRTTDLEKGVLALKSRACIIYPTETFFGLGGNALDREVGSRISAIKRRPPGKPFPLLAGSFALVQEVVSHIPEGLTALAELFWPGPLSVLLPAKKGLPRDVVGPGGHVCFRVSSHPAASQLSVSSSMVLVATSANFSGGHPPAFVEEIDSDLESMVDLLFHAGPEPGGGMPSTIVRMEKHKQLILVRPGCVSVAELEEAGYSVRRRE